MTKRSPTSDTDRALVHRATPSRGVPVHAPAEDDFTPVASVMERFEDTFVPTERERMLLHLVWQHTANMEMRARKRRDTGDTAALEQRVDDVETAIVDIRGESGNNGKIGALKARVDIAESRRWWAVTFLAGLLVTVIAASIGFGRWMSSVETDVEWLKARTYRARFSVPEFPATKDQEP